MILLMLIKVDDQENISETDTVDNLKEVLKRFTRTIMQSTIKQNQGLSWKQKKDYPKHGIPGGGYIFSTSNCIYPGMDPKRYELILDVWRKESNYL